VYLNLLVIKKDSTCKGIFDFIMLFVACQNIFANAYHSAFGIPTSTMFLIADTVIEGLFMFDILLNFCEEYLDEETFVYVSDFLSIAQHYLKRTFVVDFLACLPITVFLSVVDSDSESLTQDQVRLFRLIKLLRLPRLLTLFNLQKFQTLL
jgi:hypothetical protein